MAFRQKATKVNAPTLQNVSGGNIFQSLSDFGQGIIDQRKQQEKDAMAAEDRAYLLDQRKQAGEDREYMLGQRADKEADEAIKDYTTEIQRKILTAKTPEQKKALEEELVTSGGYDPLAIRNFREGILKSQREGELFDLNKKLKNSQINLTNKKIKTEGAPTRADQKAAYTRAGLKDLYKQYEIPWNDSLTNDQLGSELKSKVKKIEDQKEKTREDEASGVFKASKKDGTVSEQRNKFLEGLLSERSLPGTLFSAANPKEEIKDEKDNIDRFMTAAKIKLGTKYNEKELLNLIANAREKEVTSMPGDTLMQDALETVAETIGLDLDDF